MRFRGIEVGDALAIQRPRRRPCDLSTPTAGLRLVVATARLRLEVPGQAPAPRSVPRPVPQMGLRSCGGHMPPRVPGGPALPKLAGWVCWRPCAPSLAGESARRTCLPRPAEEPAGCMSTRRLASGDMLRYRALRRAALLRTRRSANVLRCLVSSWKRASVIHHLPVRSRFDSACPRVRATDGHAAPIPAWRAAATRAARATRHAAMCRAGEDPGSGLGRTPESGIP